MGAAAATTLAGCDSGSSGDAGGCTLSVPALVLCTWTLLCMLYSWKIDLEGLDHICSTARFFIGATTDSGELRSTEFDGSTPCRRAPEWSPSDAKDVLGRCLDLRQAYKQLVRHPCDAWAAVLAVLCPADGNVYFFEAIALPFGAVSSVVAFNRAARALRTILSRTFDDFCRLELNLLKDSAWKTAETVMQLLGWNISSGEDKRKPFAKSFEILGAVISFKPSPTDLIEVCNKETRLAQLEEQVLELKKSLHASVSRTQLESIKGRLLYAAGHTFGRCTQLACQLLHRLGGAGPSIKVTPELVYAVSEALAALKSAGPRTIQPWEGLPPVLVFSDGAVENDGATVTHGALLVDPALNVSFVFWRPCSKTIRVGLGANWEEASHCPSRDVSCACSQMHLEATIKRKEHFVVPGQRVCEDGLCKMFFSSD